MTVIDRQPPVSEPPDPPRRKDRTHWLYIAVIVAVLVGVTVGLLAPDVGKSVGVLGTMFVSLIKMMIVAGHLLHDRARHRHRSVQAATVGKVGGLAFVYFLVMSTVRAGDRPRRRQPAPAPAAVCNLSESAAGQGRRTGREGARSRAG